MLTSRDFSVEGKWVVEDDALPSLKTIFIPLAREKLDELKEVHREFDIRTKIKIIGDKARIVLHRDTPVGSLNLTTISLDNRLSGDSLLGNHVLKAPDADTRFMFVLYDELRIPKDKDVVGESFDPFTLCTGSLVFEYVPSSEDICVARFWREKLYGE